MSNEVKLLKLRARRTILLARDRENRNVVRKIDRQIRSLEAA